LSAHGDSFFPGATGAVTAYTNTDSLGVSQTGDATKPVVIHNVGTSALLLQNGSTVKTLQLDSKGGISAGNFGTTSGDIKLTATTGVLQVTGNLQANEGSVILHNLDDKGGGSIDIANNASVTTHVTKPVKGTLGIVQIYLGASAGSAAGTMPGTLTPSQVQTTGKGKVLWGANGITANVSAGTLIQALNQTVQFSTGAAGASVIHLGDNVHITADPPASPVSRVSGDTVDFIVDTEFDGAP
jgi:hypothetical protein